MPRSSGGGARCPQRDGGRRDGRPAREAAPLPSAVVGVRGGRRAVNRAAAGTGCSTAEAVAMDVAPLILGGGASCKLASALGTQRSLHAPIVHNAGSGVAGNLAKAEPTAALCDSSPDNGVGNKGAGATGASGASTAARGGGAVLWIATGVGAP
eukprot:scaffold3162_cov101-Isochrysis_galbana.AAC.4